MPPKLLGPLPCTWVLRMYTGLIQTVGDVVCSNSRLAVLKLQHAPNFISHSVSLSGVSHTFKSISKAGRETFLEVRQVDRGPALEGAMLNVEFATSLQDELGGNYLLGTPNCSGSVLQITSARLRKRLSISIGDDETPIVAGDAVALDGVAMTVARFGNGVLEVHLIEDTIRHTTLGRLQPGMPVVIERDFLGLRRITPRLK